MGERTPFCTWDNHSPQPAALICRHEGEACPRLACRNYCTCHSLQSTHTHCVLPLSHNSVLLAHNVSIYNRVQKTELVFQNCIHNRNLERHNFDTQLINPMGKHHENNMFKSSAPLCVLSAHS